MIIVNQFMRVHTLFTVQWNNDCNKQSKDIISWVNIGVLEENYCSEWVSILPSIAIPKKNGTIRVFADFRKLNLLLKRMLSPIPIPKLGEMIGSIEKISFASAICYPILTI
jgi:hypothetical protein